MGPACRERETIRHCCHTQSSGCQTLPSPKRLWCQRQAPYSFSLVPALLSVFFLPVTSPEVFEVLKAACADQRCQLTSYPVGRRFKEDTQLNTLMADLFQGIVEGTLAVSLPPVTTSLHLAPCLRSPDAHRFSRDRVFTAQTCQIRCGCPGCLVAQCIDGMLYVRCKY